MHTRFGTLKLLGTLVALFCFDSASLKATISVQARASSTVIELGQSINLYTDGYDSNGTLIGLTGWVRGPGTYPVGDWSGWSAQIIASGFSGTTSSSASASYTPTATGTYQFHANAYNTNGTYAGTDINNWASWNTYASGPAIAATFTVIPPGSPAHVEVQARASSYTINLGGSITLYADGRMSNGATAGLTQLTGWVRGPGNYSTSSPWTGWSLLISETFGSCVSNSKSASFTPTSAGTYQFHANAVGNGVYAGTDINNWISWNSYAAGPAVAATFTVLSNASYSTPAYAPTYWNDSGTIQFNNNCYNYSNNRRTDTYAQPGRASGNIYSNITATEVSAGAVSDGLEPTTASATSSTGKTLSALVIWPGYDYHWYRRDSNGAWSHKPGGTQATNLDNSGNIITNPETANRGGYTQFVGYFFTPSDAVQGEGHANIN